MQVVYANTVWINFCGLKLDAHAFPDWLDTVHHEDVPLINEWWYKVTRLKQSGRFQIRSKMPFTCGNMALPYRTAIIEIYPELDADDNVTNVMSLVTDTSDLKWHEEQLCIYQREIEDVEKNFRTFAELAPVRSHSSTKCTVLSVYSMLSTY